MSIDYFLAELKTTLNDYFNVGTVPCPWAAAALECDNCYIIKAQARVDTTEIIEAEIPPRLRRLVIWTFSADGKMAWIRLDKPLDFAAFTAQLMVGNLFGQGLERVRLSINVPNPEVTK